jgi:hypothetical protein
MRLSGVSRFAVARLRSVGAARGPVGCAHIRSPLVALIVSSGLRFVAAAELAALSPAVCMYCTYWICDVHIAIMHTHKYIHAVFAL